ncbi:MAG: tetratricopeptide repeat protein [Bacteroidales bacterium]
MKKLYPIFQWSVLFLTGCLLISLSSCNEKKNNPINASHLTLYKTKAVSCLKSHSDSGLRYVDSAFRIITALKLNDSVITGWLLLKADIHLAIGQKDSAYNTFIDARDKAVVLGNNTIQAYADLWLGQQFTDDGKYFMAGKYLKEGLILNEKSGSRYQVARSYNLYGTLLSFNGDFQLSQEYLIKAAGIFEKSNNNGALSAVYINIAANYEAINDDEKALVYFRKSLKISLQQKDTVNNVSTLNNLGIHYRATQPDSAAFYFMEALKFKQSPKVTFEIVSVKFNLANLYFDRKEFDNALLIYNQVMDICTRKGIYSGLARTYNGIANIYEARNNDAKAVNFYRKAYRLADSIGDTPTAMVFLGNIQYMQEKQRNFEGALGSSKKITEAKDSLLSLEKQISIHDLEMLYNKERTEREIIELNSKVLLQKSSIMTNRIVLFIVIVSIVVLLILLRKIYNLYRQRDDAYNALILKYRESTLPQDPGIKTPDSKNPANALIPEDDDPDYQRLVTYFENSKPYLSSDLHVDEVARELKIGRKLLSHLLSEHAGMNFTTFVNSYRIKEILRLLAEPKFQQFKIEALAKQAGFGSKASFYTAFSNITGSKPSEYR